MTCITRRRGEMVEERHPRVVERDGRLAVVGTCPCSSVAPAATSTSTPSGQAARCRFPPPAATALSTTSSATTRERPGPDVKCP